MTDRVITPTDRRRAGHAATDGNTEAAQRERDLLDELHAAVLDTPRGRDLMAHIRKHTIDRGTPPDISDGALRGLEAVRNFVRDLETRITKHRERGASSKG